MDYLLQEVTLAEPTETVLIAEGNEPLAGQKSSCLPHLDLQRLASVASIEFEFPTDTNTPGIPL